MEITKVTSENTPYGIRWQYFDENDMVIREAFLTYKELYLIQIK